MPLVDKTPITVPQALKLDYVDDFTLEGRAVVNANTLRFIRDKGRGYGDFPVSA